MPKIASPKQRSMIPPANKNGLIIHNDENPAPCNLPTNKNIRINKNPCVQHLLHNFDPPFRTCALSSSLSSSVSSDWGPPPADAPAVPVAAAAAVAIVASGVAASSTPTDP